MNGYWYYLNGNDGHRLTAVNGAVLPDRQRRDGDRLGQRRRYLVPALDAPQDGHRLDHLIDGTYHFASPAPRARRARRGTRLADAGLEPRAERLMSSAPGAQRN